jgi:hypothetical protein
MANYKRKRCRYCGRNRRDSETHKRIRCGLKPVKVDYENLRIIHASAYRDAISYIWPSQYSFLNNYPSAWDIQYHTRPRRAQEKHIARAILKGTIDPDEAIWPLSKKPHIYYW